MVILWKKKDHVIQCLSRRITTITDSNLWIYTHIHTNQPYVVISQRMIFILRLSVFGHSLNSETIPYFWAFNPEILLLFTTKNWNS